MHFPKMHTHASAWPVVALCAVAGLFTPLAVRANALSTLYRFTGGSDGGEPAFGVVYHDGSLYGTTLGGGRRRCNCGAVFKIDAFTGAESVLGGYHPYHDGAPLNGLTFVNGKLFSLTEYGGHRAFGSIIEIDPVTGDVDPLYDIRGGWGGAWPHYGLTYYGGAFYGSTDGFYFNGRRDDDGTVFRFVPSTGIWTVLHHFVTQNDGISPSGLTYHDGFLYGTSLEGGKTGCMGGDGCGTVFKVNAETGAETVLYTFHHASHSPVYPQGVVYADGFLYGTTLGAGDYNEGFVFKLDPNSGAMTRLYSFRGGNDASQPNAVLSYHGSALYGTSGYFTGSCIPDGCGTVFEVDRTTGAEKVLYRFDGGADGGFPEGGVIYQGGALYGTARIGGGTGCGGTGCGTVFKLTP